MYLSLVGTVFMILAMFSQRFHLLSLLVTLEGLMLMVLMYFYNMSWIISVDELFIILITLAVCEAALGLTVLVSILRSWGNDFVSVLALNNW